MQRLLPLLPSPSVMKFKFKTSKVSTQQERFFNGLPYEIQEHIVIQFMKDPHTTFEELKALRLVSKAFNEIIAPRVLPCLILFKYDYNRQYYNYRRHIVDSLRQHLALSSSRQHSDLDATVRLTIHGWHWIYDYPFPSYKSVPHIGRLVTTNLLLSCVYFIKFLLGPQTLPISIYHGALRLCGRVCLSRTSRFNLPNVRCVVVKFEREDPKWILSHTVNLILQLPKLDELTLVIDEELEEYDYFIERICQIHNLRKLKIVLNFRARYRYDPREHDIDKLGKIIAANPNLTHLDIHKPSAGRPYNLLDIFRHVHSHLKLEHLGVQSRHFEGSSAIVPHIYALTSCNFSDSRFLAALLAEEVFPPTMVVEGIDDLTITYLNRHPRITSISLPRIRRADFTAIFDILVRHANTLIDLEIEAMGLVDSLGNEWNELLLLRCTNLQQLTLYSYVPWQLCSGFRITPREEKMLAIVSRLGDSLTVVITDLKIFKECLWYCNLMRSDSLFRSLARRLVYKRACRDEQYL